MHIWYEFSEFLDFWCPDVRHDNILHQEKKNEVFDDHRPVEKVSFLAVFTIFHIGIKVSEYLISRIMMSRHDDILHFRRLSIKPKNLKFFYDSGPVEKKSHFLLFSQFAYLASKSMLLFVCLFVCSFYSGFTSLSTIFQSYRDGVLVWQRAQCSFQCCLSEISRPRHLT